MAVGTRPDKRNHIEEMLDLGKIPNLHDFAKGIVRIPVIVARIIFNILQKRCTM